MLDAALVLFARQSFHGTTVPDVAERARVATGTVYRYYADKEALVNAVYRRCNESLLVAMLEDFPVDAPVRVQFHEMWRRLWGFAARRPEIIDFLELHDHETYIDDESAQVQDRLLEPIVFLLSTAQAKKKVKPLPPMTLVSIAWGAFIGLYKGVRKRHLTLNDELLSTSEDAVWDALRA